MSNANIRNLANEYSKNVNNLEILEKLLKTHDKNIISELLPTILNKIESIVSIDDIKLLIKYGADVNYINYTCECPLLYCCMDPITSIEIIEFLIESGANVNIKSSTGRTPLTCAIRNSNKDDDLKIIKLLIRKGSEINCKNIFDETPLMMCFKNNKNKLIRYDMIKILLDNKADIYVKNDNNENILDIVKDKIDDDKQNFDIYSLIFNYKNLVNVLHCEYDFNFIYKHL